MAQLIEKNGDLIVRVEWTAEDVHECAAECLDMTLTPNQARDALRLLAATHDASIGINWETIECAIQSILSPWMTDPELVDEDYVKRYGQFAGYELDDDDIKDILGMWNSFEGMTVAEVTNQYLADYEA